MDLNELLAMLMAYALVMLAIGVFQIICWWKVFAKAGKPGWAAIVPIYNLVVLIQVAKKPTWWILWFFLPSIFAMMIEVAPLIALILVVVSVITLLVIVILLQVGLAKAFGQGGGFAAGLIFLNIIFMAILAFGKYDHVDGQQSAEAILD